MRREIVDNDEKLNFIDEKEEDRTIEGLKKDYSDKIKNLEEAISIYMSENDLKILKTEFPDKWKYLNKRLAYPYEYFLSTNDYQKPVNKLKTKDIFIKLNKNGPSNEERTNKRKYFETLIIKFEKI